MNRKPPDTTADENPAATSTAPQLNREPTRVADRSSVYESVKRRPRTRFEEIFPLYVLEDNDHINVRAFLYGIAREQLELLISREKVRIKVALRERSPENDLSTERFPVYLVRNCPLSQTVDPNRSKASFEDGILHVRMPKGSAWPARDGKGTAFVKKEIQGHR